MSCSNDFHVFILQKRYGKIRNAFGLKKKERVSRPTIVLIEGSSRKKNLAFYDPEIYELLKLKKKVQVPVASSAASAVPRGILVANATDDSR